MVRPDSIHEGWKEIDLLFAMEKNTEVITMKNFEGKVAIITGAAYGFGKEFVKQAAQRKMKMGRRGYHSGHCRCRYLRRDRKGCKNSS